MAATATHRRPVAARGPKRESGGPLSPLSIGLHLTVAALVSFVALWRTATVDPASDQRTYLVCGYRYLEGKGVGCNFEHPPLAKVVLGIALHLFGNTPAVGQAVVGVLSIATAIVLYLLVRSASNWALGLVAAGLWGLTPQAGVENGTVTEAFRITRFALLDPFLCFFFALALLGGWLWWQRRSWWWAALTGFSCVAAACSKEVGMVLAPSIIAMPLLAIGLQSVRTAVRDAGIVAAGGVVAFIASYAAFGPAEAWSEIRYLITFQLHHASLGASPIFHGHLYPVAPWWAITRYGIDGLGAGFAVFLAAAAVAGILGTPALSLYALIPSGVILAVMSFSHLAYPFYWVDVEPGVIVAAALGIGWCCTARWSRITAVVASVVLVGVPSASMIVDIATASPGVYRQAAARIDCPPGCILVYLGYRGMFESDLTGKPVLGLPGGPNILLIGQGTPDQIPTNPPGIQSRLPDYVVVDPLTAYAQFIFVAEVTRFEAIASQLGYVEVPSGSRLKIWKLSSYGPTGATLAAAPRR